MSAASFPSRSQAGRAVALALLFAGCLEVPDAGPVVAPTPAPEPPRNGANLTSCTGARLNVLVPHEWLAARVADGMAPPKDRAGMSIVRVQFATCGKIAIEGRDIGPASFTWVRAPVAAPSVSASGAEPVEFILELRVDSPAFAEWYGGAAAPSLGRGTTQHTRRPLPYLYEQVSAATTAESTQWYVAEGTGRSGTAPASQASRLAWKVEDAVASARATTWANESVGLAPATLRAAGGSLLGGLAPVHEAMLLRSDVSAWVIQPDGPRRGA